MNNTIEINQSFQKFNEILSARHIISQWRSTGSVFSKLFQIISSGLNLFHLLLPVTKDCYLFDKQSWCTIQYLLVAN